MKTTNYDNLVKSCPLLFSLKKVPRNQCPIYISAPDGWYEPIADLSEKIELFNQYIYKKYKVIVRAEDVKEKYGTLRFYYYIEKCRDSIYLMLGDTLSKICFKLDEVYKRLTKSSFDGIFELGLKIENYFEDLHDTRYYFERDVYDQIDSLIEDWINDCSTSCFHRCEVCGKEIGTKQSARFQTQGYIRYVCEEHKTANSKPC